MKRIGVALVVLVAVSACTTGNPYGDNSANAFAAQDACRNSVKLQLLSAPSAHFSGENRVFTGTKAAPKFQITGTVSADNAFGAPLQRSWTCRAHSSDGGNDWNALATLEGS